MTSKPKRPYRKRKRAEAEEETRRRITEAAVQLHGTVGPARTTITEVAELAGVSRVTVYNHFPSEADLFQACSSHWMRQNPRPDPAGWLEHDDPDVRVARALEELYGWYERKQGMLENVLRDAPVNPTLGELMEGVWGDYMDEIVGVLLDGRTGGDLDALAAALHVVVDFHTWRLLSVSERTTADAVEVATRMAGGAARGIGSAALLD